MRVVSNFAINISPSNIFQSMLLSERFHGNYQAAFDFIKYLKSYLNDLRNVAPLNISSNIVLAKIFHQNCHAVWTLQQSSPSRKWVSIIDN